MKNKNETTVYELCLGTVSDGKLTNTKPIGTVIRYADSPYYIAKQAGARYFIRKKQGSKLGYVVFGRRPKHGRAPIIGSARLSESLKTHLEISVRGASTPVFMSLYPKERAVS